jgi:uncharacterized protein (TIGR02145 family)
MALSTSALASLPPVLLFLKLSLKIISIIVFLRSQYMKNFLFLAFLIVLVATGCSLDDGNEPEFATIEYGGQAYKTVGIGNQTWMAENLNYNATGSGNVCYDNKPENCAKYGRLYDWNTAKMACPSGWRLPSDTDWDNLMAFIGGSSTAGRHLKAKSGWNGGNGSDTYGFLALPGGFGYGNSGYPSDEDFSYIGDYGLWWSSSQRDSDDAYVRGMDSDNPVHWTYYYKQFLLSVRCVKD